MSEHPGLHPAPSGPRRAADPLTDPLDPDDLLPLDPPGDPALWDRDRHPFDEHAMPSRPGDGISTGDTPIIDTPASLPHAPEQAGWHVQPTLPPASPAMYPGPEREPPRPMASTEMGNGLPAAFASAPVPPVSANGTGPTFGAPEPASGRAGPPGFSPPREPSGPMPAIVAHGLQKRFGDHVAVADVTFSVAKGTILGLLGPNGAGKTTTVNMLCTLLKPDGGTAFVAGHDVAADPAGVRRSIMLTGQFAALDESLTGRENLVLFGRLLGLSKPAARTRADELLNAFGLTDAAARRVREYSGGMRRRIDIACGLVTRPEVVFLDEPTTGLDPRSRAEVWHLVEDLRAQGVTILLTTQYLEEADALADQIVVIDHGRVIAGGTADELKSQIGASYYAVTPAAPDDCARIHDLLADLLPADQQPPAGDALSVVVPAVADEDILVDIVRRTSEAGIRLSDVALRRPTLDEVFLTLTSPTAPGTSRVVEADPDSPTAPIAGTPIR